MPIFEYICRDCTTRFETIVTGARTPVCPSCQSASLDRQHSVFAVSTKSSSTSTPAAGACGACGDPRGPGSCQMN